MCYSFVPVSVPLSKNVVMVRITSFVSASRSGKEVAGRN